MEVSKYFENNICGISEFIRNFFKNFEGFIKDVF